MLAPSAAVPTVVSVQRLSLIAARWNFSLPINLASDNLGLQCSGIDPDSLDAVGVSSVDCGYPASVCGTGNPWNVSPPVSITFIGSAASLAVQAGTIT